MWRAGSAVLMAATVAAAQTPASDLYTIELIGTPELQRFTGIAELRPAASPFTAPVTAQGVHRFDVFISADSLPQPSALGAYHTFVVWAAPPTMRSMLKLGELKPGAARSVRVG